MGRPPRLDHPGACVYVTACSGLGLSLFSDDPDRLRYLQTAEQAAYEAGYRCLAYCLLPQDAHLVMKSGPDPRQDISRFMKVVSQRYSRYWGGRYQSKGHLFAGRFRSLIVDEQRFLGPLIAYLHRLPALHSSATGQVFPRSWTSDAAYGGETSGMEIDRQPLADYLSAGDSTSFSESYRRLMKDGHGEMAVLIREALKNGVLGGEDFLLREGIELAQGQRTSAGSALYTFNELIEAVREVYGVSEADLIGRGRKEPVSVPREVLTYLAFDWLRKPAGHIAFYLRRDPSLISRIIRKLKRRPAWRTEVSRIQAFLEKRHTGPQT